MLLSEIFSYVSELDSASLDMDTDGDGVIVSAHYNKVIKAINLGLMSLYSEFPIKEKMVVVQLHAHITDYLLTTEFSATNGTAVYKYIMDTTFDPFVEDILKILVVSDEGGSELPLNTNNQLYSVYTPQYNMVQHPFPDDDNAIFITYRARHPEIAFDATPSTYDVFIPGQLLPLLLVFINHKLLASVNKEDSIAKLNEYFGLVSSAKTLGLFNQESSSNEKLDNNGWE